MKKFLKITLIASLPLLLTGCLSQMATPVNGLYIDTSSTIAVTSETSGSKVGTAECSSVLFIIASGNCSVEEARKNGGITKISHVDGQAKSYLGIYSTYTVKVYGE